MANFAFGQFFSKCSHFSNRRSFSELFFAHDKSLQCASRIVFRTFLAFLIFDTKGFFAHNTCSDRFAKCIAFASWPGFFGHFQNALIFRIEGLFSAPFWFFAHDNFFHFPNIRPFSEGFFARNTSNVVVKLFIAPFWHF